MSARKNHKLHLKKQKEEEKAHIMVKQTNDFSSQKLRLNKTSKATSGSLASVNNVGSQTITDAVLTTIIRKQTESGSSELGQPNFHHRVRTEYSPSHTMTGSISNNFSNYLRLRHNLSKRRLNSRANTDENSRLKSSYSAADNIGHIDTIQDERFNRHVQLREEEDKYDSDESDDVKINPDMEDSIQCMRRIRSRDFSQSTNKSNQNYLVKRNPNASGTLYSGLPSNRVIQETLRKQYNNSGISRKDYSKRTRVSVLDSSLSSLYKNSALGEYQNVENQNRDPNFKGKSISSGESYKGKVYAQTNPKFQMNKFKDISHGFRQTNLAKSNQFLEFSSPRFRKDDSSLTPDSSCREFAKDLSNTRRWSGFN